MDESQLVKQLKANDAKAVPMFVNLHARFVYSICFQILRNKFDAEEACQDTMMKAIKAIQSFKESNSFRTWLYAIAYHTAIDYKRRVKYNLDIEDVHDQQSSMNADDELHTDETKKKIDALLEKLEDEDRQLIQLFYLEEMSIKEVVEITGLTESNVKIKLFRARKYLAEHTSQYFEIELENLK